MTDGPRTKRKRTSYGVTYYEVYDSAGRRRGEVWPHYSSLAPWRTKPDDHHTLKDAVARLTGEEATS